MCHYQELFKIFSVEKWLDFENDILKISSKEKFTIKW